MKELKNVEVFHIETTKEGMFAYISYQDVSKETEFPNNGYDLIRVPINPREIQLSSHGNVLINQSKQLDNDAIPNTKQTTFK